MINALKDVYKRQDVGNAGDWVSAKRYSVLCQPFQPLRHTGKGGLLLAVQLRGQRIVMLRQDAVDNEKLILNTQLPQFTGSAIGFLQRCCFRSRYQEQRGLVAACKGCLLYTSLQPAGTSSDRWR